MEERRVSNIHDDGLRKSLLTGHDINTNTNVRTLPKTGCADSDDGSNQSKKLLFATFKKNCDPPDFGAPIK